MPLKANTDKAVAQCPNVHTVLVVENTGGDVEWNDKHDVWYHDMAEQVDSNCEPEEMDAEDPLFILYTSGSTGKPKGVLHTTAGYLLYAAVTHKYTFDYKKFAASLAVNNLFDEVYAEYGEPDGGFYVPGPAVWPGDGRTFLGTISYRF